MTDRDKTGECNNSSNWNGHVWMGEDELDEETYYYGDNE